MSSVGQNMNNKNTIIQRQAAPATAPATPVATPVIATEVPVASPAGVPTLLKSSTDSLNAGAREGLAVLDESRNESAAYVRKMAVILSILLQSPEMQKNLALLVISGGHFLADLIYNSGQLANDMSFALGPAARQWAWAGSNLFRDSALILFSGAVNMIPIVGPIIGTSLGLTDAQFQAASQVIWQYPLVLDRTTTAAEGFNDNMKDANKQLEVVAEAFRYMGEAAAKIAEAEGGGEELKNEARNLESQIKFTAENKLNSMNLPASAVPITMKSDLKSEVPLAPAPPSAPTSGQTFMGGSKKRKYRKKTGKRKKLKKGKKKTLKKKKKQRRKKGTKKKALH